MAKWIILCLLAMLSLVGCQATSNQPGNTLTVQLNLDQVIGLKAYLAKDMLMHDPGSDSVVRASITVNLGLSNYLTVQPSEPITFTLKSKDGLLGYGSVSWYFDDTKEGQQTHSFKTKQVDELIKLFKAWQATDQTAQ